MKILIIANYANGIFLFRKELIATFKQAGHTVVISVPFDENIKKLEDMGIKLLYSPLYRRGMNPLKDFKLFLNYVNIIKKEKPQIILTYTIKPNIYGAMAARLAKIPYICNVTGLGTAIQNGGILSKILIKLYSFSMAKAMKVFFQNGRNMKFLQEKGVAVRNADLLPGSGVNLLEHPFREYPVENGSVRFLAVLRVMKDKGVSEYLEAAKVISSEYADTCFELVGEYEEDERAVYEPLINEMQNAGIIKYYGHLDDVETVMAKSHVIVHPSYHEGLSNVLIEAAACGRPVIATDVPGCGEAYDDGASGIAFKPHDTDDLIRAIKEFLALSYEKRAEMGRAGRAKIENEFDRHIIINKYLEILRSIEDEKNEFI